MKFTLASTLIAASTLLVACEVQNGAGSKGYKRDSSGRPINAAGNSGDRMTGGGTKGTTNNNSGSGSYAQGLNWKGQAFPTGVASTSAVMLRKGTPSEVSLNQPFEYVLEVSNLTNQNLEDVVVSERLPAKFTLKNSTPATASRDKGTASWVFAKLAPREKKIIRVTGTPTGEGNLIGCSTVSYDSRICSTIAVTRAAIKLTKTAPSNALICEKIPVKYIVTNTGSGTARNIRVTEELSANLMAANRRPINFTIPSLAPGKSKEFTVDLQASKAGTFNGRAVVKADGNLSANSVVTSTIVKQPMLKVVAKGPEKTFLGRDITYDIVVSNTGNAPSTKTVLEDSIPAGARFVNASAGGKVSGNKVVWNVGTLEASANRKYSVTYKAMKPGTLQTSASARGHCVMNRAIDVAQTRMVGIPAILMEVIDVDDPIVVGENETYEIRITNQGTAPGTNIRLKTMLEDSMEFISASGPTSGTHSGGTVTFGALPSLAPKAKVTWKVVVKAAKSADARFKVSMITDQQTRPVEETESTNFYK